MNNEWQPITEAQKDGSELRLGHMDDPSSMKIDGLCPTYGHWDGNRWVLSSFFIVPGGKHGLMSTCPTHYLARPHADPGLAS